MKDERGQCRKKIWTKIDNETLEVHKMDKLSILRK